MKYMKQLSLILGLAMSISGCASTSVTPVAANQVMISTSAAPACGVAGAQRVAAQMAAVETIRRGFERFTIAGASAQNNVRVSQAAPTGAYTTGTFNTFGGTSYGSATTMYTGGGTRISGSNDASLLVLMYQKNDPGFGNAVDARATLGPDWQKKVNDGIKTCSK